MNIGMIIQRKYLAVIVVFAIIACTLFIFSLREPYHYDTAEYMQAVQVFKETSEIKCFPEARCFNSYSLLPLSLVFGYMTLPVTIFLSAILTLIMYFCWIKELTDRTTALISTLLLFAVPASIMTITHMKEDFLVLMYMLAALLLISKKTPGYARYTAGIFYALAILSKEMPIMFLPLFAVSIYVYNVKDAAQWGGFLSKDTLLRGAKDIAVFLVVTLVTVSVFNRHHFQSLWMSTASPYVGQFKGLFSSIFPLGISIWKYGVGVFLFFGQFFGVISPALETDRVKKSLYAVFIIQFVLLSFFLCNLTVVRYRHFLWPSLLSFPLMVVVFRNVLSTLKIRKPLSELLTWGTFVLTAVFLFYTVYPALSFHSKVNIIAGFYKNIPTENTNTLIMGMDNCIFVQYFSRLRCIGHPVDATEAQAVEFTNSIAAEMQNGTTVLILPDFFSYDTYNTMAKAFTTSFSFKDVYSAWFQNYHNMDYGYGLEEYKQLTRSYLKKTPKDDRICNTVYYKSAQGNIPAPNGAGLDIDLYTYNTYCEGGSYTEKDIPVINNRVFADLKIAGVVQLQRR
ncbi:membrane protein [Candidatus Magnetobacterium bavaricum]|uniref:Membrane protein n=1 Tax=Candidatus Magnetobacterium bavaricum TaxID=29290 RepID=A0A0F3H1R5_9BACT|nr:membrane protein [Candidatus Magnetobacterium bavaricum]